MPPRRAADATAPDAQAPGAATRAAPAPTAHAQLASHTPGRVRLRVRRTDRAELGRLQGSLAERPGVAGVTTNAATGSLLVHYDHRRLSRADVLGMLADVGMIVHELAEAPDLAAAGRSTTASGLIEAIGDLDRRLSRLTNARVDLKLLFPLALGALGLRQTFSEGLGLNQVPAYVLLWYAFDSFWKFHRESVQPSGATPADGASA